MRKIRRQSNSGFTLIELLVVMAVITILMAIVFPVIMQVKSRARGAMCLSNLKQLGAAVSMYALDYDGRLPIVYASPFAGSWPTDDCPQGTGSSWARTALSTYAGSGKVFSCPNDRGAPAFGFRAEGVFGQAGTSYLWNPGSDQMGWLVNGRQTASLPPSRVLFQDYGSNWHGMRIRSGLKVLECAEVNTVCADGHSVPLTAYSFTTDRGEYAAGVTSIGESGDVWVAGTTEYGSAYLNGDFREQTGITTYGVEFSIIVHGMIYSDGGVYEISRRFTFGGASGIEEPLRRIIDWVESILTQ